jgi:ketosteroid isomerase-like protein
MNATYGSILFAAVAFTACEVKTTANLTSISEEKTKEVLEHHWKTFQANDLEGTMADYTEESVLITPDRTYKGLNEIRENFVNAFTLLPKDSTTMRLDNTVVQQDVGYIIWQASSPKLNITYGTDTFIIQHGKIIRQTYAGVVAP